MYDELKKFNFKDLKLTPPKNNPPSESREDEQNNKIRLPVIDPPSIMHKFSTRERKYLKNLANAFYHSNQIKNS